MQKIKLYYSLLLILSVLSLLALVWLVNVLSPDRLSNLMFFYLLAGMAIFSLGTIFIFSMRRRFGQRELAGNYLSTSSRQGLWLAIILIISLFLLHRNLFNWTSALLLILTFIFFESY